MRPLRFKILNPIKNKVLRLLSLAAFFALVAILNSCTSQNNSTSRVELSLPKQFRQSKLSASSNFDIQHIAVNISASDMPTKVFIWEKKNNSDTPPISIPLEVTQGSQRLIQVLLAVQDISANTLLIKYGFQQVDLNTADYQASIDVLSIASSTVRGALAGRYTWSDGTAPTGNVNIYFGISGKPRMLVDQTEIFNGFFHFFAFHDISLDYEFEDGRSILVNTNTQSNFGNTNQTATVHIPQSYYSKNGNYQNGPEKEFVIGFFGPASTNSVCTYASSYSSALYGIFSSISPLTDLAWSYLSNEAGSAYASGGDSSPSCSSFGSDLTTNITSNYFTLDTTQFSSDDRLLGFKGPYIAPVETNVLNGSYDIPTQTLNLDWSYLPGMSSVLSGTEIFYRLDSSNDLNYINGEEIDCNGLAKNLGFKSIAQLNSSTTTYALPISEADYNLSPQIVICPFQKKSSFLGLSSEIRYFRSGARFQNSQTLSVSSCNSQMLSTLPYAGGTGTQADPYIICTAAQLDQIGQHSTDLDKSFVLLSNVDLSAYTSNSFHYIGSPATPFTGNFNGNHFTIANLTYIDNTAGRDPLGLFGVISGSAQIEDIVLSQFTLTGYDYVGGLVGKTANVTDTPIISGIKIINLSISGDLYVGGIAGFLTGDLIGSTYSPLYVMVNMGCYGRCGGAVGGSNNLNIISNNINGTINGYGSNSGFGGIVGTDNGYTRVEESSAQVQINAPSNIVAGGIFGQMNLGSVVYKSYSTANITCYNYCAGLVGQINTTASYGVFSSYANSAIITNYSGGYSGGLVGDQVSGSYFTMSYSYFAGSITGGAYRGGLLGLNNGSINFANNLYDYDSTSPSYVNFAIAAPTAQNITSQAEPATHTVMTNIAAPVWYSTTDYIFNSGSYPKLSWQP